MVPYSAGEGVEVHVLYNLHVSGEESAVCPHTGTALSLSCHSVARILQTGFVYTVLMFQGQQPRDPLPMLSIERLMVPKDLVNLKYKPNPYRGL